MGIWLGEVTMGLRAVLQMTLIFLFLAPWASYAFDGDDISRKLEELVQKNEQIQREI
jgi:hypothetical protein